MRLSVRVRALIGLCLVLGALLASYSIVAAQESGTVDTTRGDGTAAAEMMAVDTTPVDTGPKEDEEDEEDEAEDSMQPAETATAETKDSDDMEMADDSTADTSTDETMTTDTTPVDTTRMDSTTAETMTVDTTLMPAEVETMTVDTTPVPSDGEMMTVDTLPMDAEGETMTVDTTPMVPAVDTMTVDTLPMDATDDTEMMTELPTLSTPTVAVIVPVMVETPTVADGLAGLGEATRVCDASVGLVSSLELGDSDECNGLRVAFKSVQSVGTYEYPSHFGGAARQAVLSGSDVDFFLVAEVELVNVLPREISNLPLRNRFFVRDRDYGVEWESSRYFGLDGLPDNVTLAPGDSISGKIQFELPSYRLDDAERVEIVHRYWEELDTRRFRESAPWLLEGLLEGLREFNYDYEYEPLVEFIGPLPPTLPLDLGQTAAANGFQFTVMDYGFYSSYTYTEGVEAQPAYSVLYDGLFVIAEVEMVNATEHWKYLSMTDFMLWDEREVLSTPLTTQRHNNLPSGHYAPGVRYRGYLVFEVPEDAPGARLLWYTGGDPAGGPGVASYRLPRPDDVEQHLSLEDEWHAVGHAADEGSVRIAVTAVEADDPDSPQGRKLVFVDLEVSNIGVEEIEFSGQLPTLYLRDEYRNLPPSRIDLGSDDYSLLPGERATVRLIFSLPAQSQEAWFFSDSPETSVRTVWAWGANGTPGSLLEVGASQQAHGLRTTVKSAFFTKSYAYPSVFGGADLEAHAYGAFAILDIEHANVGDREIVRMDAQRQFMARNAVNKQPYWSSSYRGADALPEMFTLAPGETITGKFLFDFDEQVDLEVMVNYIDSTGREQLSNPWLVPFPDDFALFLGQTHYTPPEREAIVGARPSVESLELGQTASRGLFNAVLTDYSLHPSVRYTSNQFVRDLMPERPGEVILVATLEPVATDGVYRRTLSGTEFALWDDSGNIYYPRIDDLIWGEEAARSEGLEPTLLVFDVPEGISGAQLLWHPGITVTDTPQPVAAWTLPSSVDVGEEGALVGQGWLEVGQAAVGYDVRGTVTSVRALDGVFTDRTGYPEKIIRVEYEGTNLLDVPNVNWPELHLFYHDPTDGNMDLAYWESDGYELELEPGEAGTLQVDYRVPSGADEVWVFALGSPRAVWNFELD